METNYFEAYNRPNVRLIDLLETPIETVTKDGIKTTEETFEFDILIYATGFSASTWLGSLIPICYLVIQLLTGTFEQQLPEPLTQ